MRSSTQILRQFVVGGIYIGTPGNIPKDCLLDENHDNERKKKEEISTVAASKELESGALSYEEKKNGSFILKRNGNIIFAANPTSNPQHILKSKDNQDREECDDDPSLIFHLSL